MKRFLLLTIVVMILGVAVDRADAQSREVGLIIGEPTGLSAKFWRSGRTAVDFGVAWSFRGSGSMHLHSDYLMHMWLHSNTAFYFGLGGRLLVKDDPELAARIPIGLQLNTAGGGLALFFELAPTMPVLPETGPNLDINGGLGLRIRF